MSRPLLKGEREIDRTCPGKGWTLRCAIAPMTLNGVQYFVNSILPKEELLASPGFPALFRTGRVRWVEPDRPAGPEPRPLPPPVRTKPYPKVEVIEDSVDDVDNWDRTLRRMIELCGGGVAGEQLARDLLANDKRGVVLKARADRAWQSMWGRKGHSSVPHAL